jgi:phage terminase small subunit
MKISEKHKSFCDEYINNGFNGTKAYLAVYKSVKSEDAARTNASKLLAKANIKAYVEQKQKELRQKAEIDRDYILEEYKQLLESCKIEGLDGEGTIKDRTNWSRALAQLSKLLGLDAPDKTEITHKLEQPLFGPDEEDE